MKEALTIFLQVLAAAVQHTRHLSVDGVQAELRVAHLLLLAGRLHGHGQLQSLQQTRVTVVQVSDAVHRHAALQEINQSPFRQCPGKKDLATPLSRSNYSFE